MVNICSIHFQHRYLRVKAYPQFYTPLNKVIPLIYGEGKPFVKIEMIKYLYHMVCENNFFIF